MSVAQRMRGSLPLLPAVPPPGEAEARPPALPPAAHPPPLPPPRAPPSPGPLLCMCVAIYCHHQTGTATTLLCWSWTSSRLARTSPRSRCRCGLCGGRCGGLGMRQGRGRWPGGRARGRPLSAAACTCLTRAPHQPGCPPHPTTRTPPPLQSHIGNGVSFLNRTLSAKLFSPNANAEGRWAARRGCELRWVRAEQRRRIRAKHPPCPHAPHLCDPIIHPAASSCSTFCVSSSTMARSCC